MEENKLNQLLLGESGKIKRIDINGTMRRRLLDIGLVKDTIVSCVGKSPGGDPIAYLIRGAVIAIRNEDAKNIIINFCRGEKDGIN